MVLSGVLHRKFDTMKLGLDMLPPRSEECTAQFASAGEAWVGDKEVQLAASGGVWPSTASRVAVCIQGGVRSFPHPRAYQSIRDNLVNGLNASFLRVFYVLNLTSDKCSWCGEKDWDPAWGERHVQHQPGDLLAAFSAVGHFASLTVEPSCCWPKLRPGLHYEDCFPRWSGTVQWRGKEQCEADIDQYEVAYGVGFDWVLWTRPDVRWEFPIGDIRSFPSDRVHTTKTTYTELSDIFALVPRRYMPIYASAYRDRSANGSAFTCVTREQLARAYNQELCDFPGIAPLCVTCFFGNPGCLVEFHLEKHEVPFEGSIPEEITSRIPREYIVGGSGASQKSTA